MAEPTLTDCRLYSGAGNRFALVDEEALVGGSPATLLRELSGRGELDGLLVLGPPRAGGDVRMVIWNRDGSRPEACGNGLRCLAWHAHASGRLRATRFTVETDAGPRAVEILGPGRVRVALGAPLGIGEPEHITLGTESLQLVAVDLGNPHAVIEVPDVERAAVARVGAALNAHARFPGGVNVGFAQRVEGGLRLRVWERGVGETAACGTGAAAAVTALLGAGAARVTLAGGVLEIDRDEQGTLFLTGPVAELPPIPA